ncbi:MAG: class I SAM-dependent methyltransferase [Thermoleophilia bacterium]|nr:class I SAM-dependent methyltransferase [Thermoleophilia bacterium]
MFGYLDVLAYLHDTLRPRTYLEVGVSRGDSIRVAREESFCVGVDPDPVLTPEDRRRWHIEVMTSDEFFAGPRPHKLFGGRPIDMVFIDGRHLYEQALRDFVNAEALTSPDSLILLHDCLPKDAITSSRDRATVFWTGDVWKLVLCLLDHRPDLELSIIDVPPTGLCIVRRLNPDNRVLRDGYDAVVKEYRSLSFEDWQNRLADVLQRTTGSPEARYWALRRGAPGVHELLVASEARAADLEQQLQAVYASTSWRFSAPIRWVGAFVSRHRRVRAP